MHLRAVKDGYVSILFQDSWGNGPHGLSVEIGEDDTFSTQEDPTTKIIITASLNSHSALPKIESLGRGMLISQPPLELMWVSAVALYANTMITVAGALTTGSITGRQMSCLHPRLASRSEISTMSIAGYAPSIVSARMLWSANTLMMRPYSPIIKFTAKTKLERTDLYFVRQAMDRTASSWRQVEDRASHGRLSTYIAAKQTGKRILDEAAIFLC